MLWERSEALEGLEAALAEGTHSGQLVVVSGEVGIGKSSLIASFAERARHKADFLWGYCDHLVTPRALGPLQDIGRQSGGQLEELLSKGASQEEIFDAALALFRGPSQRRIPVAVVEDLHWADGATLDWITFVGRRIRSLSAVLILTYRDDEVGSTHPLHGMLASLPSQAVRRVRLEALSESCVAEQARLAGRDPELVMRLSDGNPLLVTELLRSPGGATPVSAQDIILDRVKNLSGPARDLAQLVAVVPARAEEQFIADCPDLASECVDAGVLVWQAKGIAYRHELLRTAVEESLAPRLKVDMHRRVLKVLAAMSTADPERLAHHARLAGDPPAILRYGQQAGAAAARHGAHHEAAAHYGAVLQHAAQLPAGKQAELWEACAREHYLSGAMEAALEARETAIRLRGSLEQPLHVAQNLRWLAMISWSLGRREDAWLATDRAIGLAQALDPGGPVLAELEAHVSLLCLVGYRLREAVTWAGRAEAHASKSDLETSLQARIVVAQARLAMGDLLARDSLLAIHQEADAGGLVDQAARTLVNLASIVSEELAEPLKAVPLMQRAFSYVEKHNLDGFMQMLLAYQALNKFFLGDWNGAVADAQAALAYSSTETGRATSLLVVARIHAAQGHPDTSSTLDSAHELAHALAEPQFMLRAAVARSEYFYWQGDTAQAQQEAAEGLKIAMSLDYQLPYWVGELSYRLWQTGARLDIPAAAAEPFKMMMNDQWRQAADQWRLRGTRHMEAEALSLGDDASVMKALEILDRLEASRPAGLLRAKLRKRGLTGIPRGPRPTTKVNSAGLTSRQTDVLVLLADGLSNADIAKRLTLSTRTVDHHVAAILEKLGSANRMQAILAAQKLGITTERHSPESPHALSPHPS